jgi:hypothetical protein
VSRVGRGSYGLEWNNTYHGHGLQGGSGHGTLPSEHSRSERGSRRSECTEPTILKINLNLYKVE